MKARIAANALDLARNGIPKQPFYLTGQVGGQPFSLHAEGEGVIMTDAADSRKEIDLVPPVPLPVEPKPSERKPEMPVPLCPMGAVTSETPDPAEPPPPGTSPLDNGMRRVMDAFQPAGISANTTGDVALNAGEVVVLVVRHQPISQPRLPRLVQAACDPRSRPTMPPAARPFRCPFGHPES